MQRKRYSLASGLASPRNRQNGSGDRTLLVIERLRRDREHRRKSIEDYKRRRARDIKRNQVSGKPGDIDFQRMIEDYRCTLSESKPHSSIGPLKINVVVRKRPISNSEIQNKDYDSITCCNPIVHVHHSKLRVDGITKFLETTKFNVDHAFGENATNVEVYKHTTKPLIEFALRGGRATCFAYGQTGSGKTFTMAGIQSIAAKEIFEILENDVSLSVHVAFFELYGGRCIDLLHERKFCVIREDGKGRVHVEGLSEVEVESMEELLEIISQGNSDRTTHATEMNSVSSRSHAICQISFRKRNSYDREPYGKLSLIDLAGSERGQDTKCHNKQRRKESAAINTSLLALKECIRALDNPGRHVPYRVSKLTMVLKDSFSKDAKTVMISCVSPAASSSDHTLNTLRYADRVKEKDRKKLSARNRNKRRQTIATHSFGYKRSSARSGLRTVNTPRKQENSSSSRSSDPPQEQLSSSSVEFDVEKAVDSAIEKYEMEVEEENESDLSNTSKNPKLLKSRSLDEAALVTGRVKKRKVKLQELESKSDWCQSSGNSTSTAAEAIEPLYATMSFKELVSRLVDEEDELLNCHIASIERNAVLVKEESKVLQKVKAQNVVDYDIDEYTEKLGIILKERLQMYDQLYTRLKTFRKHLAMEGVRT